jgi:hypothetical protein
MIQDILHEQQMHFGFMHGIYCIVVTNMFRPLMWPSSGWREQEYKFFCQCNHMSLVDFVVSPPGCGQSVTDF